MILGIDPGATGAIAWMSNGGCLVHVAPLPVVKGQGLMPAALAAMIHDRDDISHAFVERVAARPGAGGHHQPGRQLPGHEGHARQQRPGNVLWGVDGTGPHGVVERCCEHADHGCVHPSHCTLNAIALAQRLPKWQGADHQEECRNEDGEQ